MLAGPWHKPHGLFAARPLGFVREGVEVVGFVVDGDGGHGGSIQEGLFEEQLIGDYTSKINANSISIIKNQIR